MAQLLELWSTTKEQSQNRTTSRKINVNGETMTVAQASDRYGVPIKTLWSRVNSGRWDDTEAATTPAWKGVRHLGKL